MESAWRTRLAKLIILIGEIFLPDPPPAIRKYRATVRFGDTILQFNLEGDFMANFAVQNNHPDEQFTVDVGEVRDAEGELLEDSSVDVVVESTDPEVVAVDQAAGTVSFGRSGTATVQATVRKKNDPDADPLGSFAANFTVTTGDPSAVSGGSFNFPNLTPIPETPPVEPTEPTPTEPTEPAPPVDTETATDPNA
jgi:hypothetical protein